MKANKKKHSYVKEWLVHVHLMSLQHLDRWSLLNINLKDDFNFVSVHLEECLEPEVTTVIDMVRELIKKGDITVNSQKDSFYRDVAGMVYDYLPEEDRKSVGKFKKYLKKHAVKTPEVSNDPNNFSFVKPKESIRFQIKICKYLSKRYVGFFINKFFAPRYLKNTKTYDVLKIHDCFNSLINSSGFPPEANMFILMANRVEENICEILSDSENRSSDSNVIVGVHNHILDFYFEIDDTLKVSSSILEPNDKPLEHTLKCIKVIYDVLETAGLRTTK